MILSCSAVSTPMLSSASLVPQSGQMGPEPSLAVAGGRGVGLAAPGADRNPKNVVFHFIPSMLRWMASVKYRWPKPKKSYPARQTRT